MTIEDMDDELNASVASKYIDEVATIRQDMRLAEEANEQLDLGDIEPDHLESQSPLAVEEDGVVVENELAE